MNFARLHGAGNDFLLFDGRDVTAEALVPLVPALCHRHTGVGADGVLLLVPGEGPRARVLYWNADGSNAAFCANGTRCAARFVAERWGLAEIELETGYAVIPAVVAGAMVTLSLPSADAVHPWQQLALGRRRVRSRYLRVGVPHLVVPVGWRRFWEHPLEPEGPALRRHRDLPDDGANVNFVAVEGSRALAVRSWERGVEGETLSCGSGIVAAAMVALASGDVLSPVEVMTASGRTLVVTSTGDPLATPVRLSGPAEWVADGVVAPELLEAVSARAWAAERETRG